MERCFCLAFHYLSERKSVVCIGNPTAALSPILEAEHLSATAQQALVTGVVSLRQITRGAWVEVGEGMSTLACTWVVWHSRL